MLYRFNIETPTIAARPLIFLFRLPTVWKFSQGMTDEEGKKEAEESEATSSEAEKKVDDSEASSSEAGDGRY